MRALQSTAHDTAGHNSYMYIRWVETDFLYHMSMQGLRLSGTIPHQGPMGGDGRPLAAPVTSLTPVGRSPPRTASQLPAPN